MDAYLDHLLDELIAVEPREEWQDVLARARRSRRRYLAAFVVAAALLLAPAAWAVAQAFEGKPAPQSIKSTLRENNKMTAQMAKALQRQNPTAAKRLRQQPKAIVSKTHGVIQVQTTDGPIDLWAAPATDGGTCYFVGWQSDLHKMQAAGNSTCAPATASRSNKGSSAHNLNLSTWGDYHHRNYNIIQGYAYDDATTVRVALSNGSTQTLPVVEGLFLGALQQSVHWRQRPKIVSVTSRNAHGHLVGYWRRPPR